MNDKKKQIRQELINFTREKMLEFGFLNNITDGTLNYDLTSLLLCIDSRLQTKADKNEFFRHCTHYILKVAGKLQGWEIVWWQEDDESLRGNPLIEFNSEGMLDSLKLTKKHTR